MHQAPISHPNNLYSVERIHDDNVNANNFSITPSGLKYYTILITPNDYSQLVCSGNFTIDGLSSSWVYNSDYHPSAGGGVNSCYPVNPPWHGSGVGKSLAHSTPHSYILKGGAGSNTCWGPNSPSGQNFTGNGTYRFNGPFEFDNSVYCDGAFLSQFSNPVTWRKIILMDIYENDQGALINDLYDPATYSEDLEMWLQYMPDPSNPNFVPLEPTHNGYPKHIKAFIFPEYHPEVDLQARMDIDLDIDYVIDVLGCTDVSALNYDSFATVNDGSCTYAPAPLAMDPPVVTSDISSANHTVYTLLGIDGTTLGGPLDILVLNTLDISIPTPTGGTAPYEDFNIESVIDNLNPNGVYGQNNAPPSEVYLIDDALSTLDPSDPSGLTYLDAVLNRLPINTNIFLGVNPGTYSFGKVILEIAHDPANSPNNGALHEISIEISAEDDAGGNVTAAPLVIDILSQY